MNLKEFFIPDWRKLVVYLIFVIIFMSEVLLIRIIYQRDYMVVILTNIYNHFFLGKGYINFFTLSFFFYLVLLVILYLLSCLVILIIEKTEK